MPSDGDKVDGSALDRLLEHSHIATTPVARQFGWDAAAVHGEDPAAPLAFYHAWVRLPRHGKTFDVDWTARQYHNLHDHAGHDPAVLSLPWPLTWDPIAVGVDAHPIGGEFAAVTKEDQ